MKQEKWIEQLRDKLANHEMAAPEGLWEDIEAALPASLQDKQPRQARIVALRRWAAAASFAALLGIGGYWWWASDSHSQQPSEAIPNEHLVAQKAPEPSVEAPKQEVPIEAETPKIHQRAKIPPKALEARIYQEPQTSYEPQEVQEVQEVQKYQEVQKTPKPQENLQRVTASHSDHSDIQRYDGQIAQLQPVSSKSGLSVSLYAMNGFGSQSGSNGVIMSSNLTQNFTNHADYQTMMSRGQETIYLAGYEEREKHYQPVSFGLTVSYPLTPRLSLSSGIVFTHLQSDFASIMRSQQINRKQQLDYIGIPLAINYKLWCLKGLRTYLSAGLQADWNVHTSLRTNGVSQQLDKDRVQLSAAGALGVQYNIIPQLGLYAEPGIRHYFDNGSPMQNFFKDKPTNFSLQLGLRLNLGE